MRGALKNTDPVGLVIGPGAGGVPRAAGGVSRRAGGRPRPKRRRRPRRTSIRARRLVSPPATSVARRTSSSPRRSTCCAAWRWSPPATASSSAMRTLVLGSRRGRRLFWRAARRGGPRRDVSRPPGARGAAWRAGPQGDEPARRLPPGQAANLPPPNRTGGPYDLILLTALRSITTSTRRSRRSGPSRSGRGRRVLPMLNGLVHARPARRRVRRRCGAGRGRLCRRRAAAGRQHPPPQPARASPSASEPGGDQRHTDARPDQRLEFVKHEDQCPAEREQP